jgi:hypothetical protein
VDRYDDYDADFPAADTTLPPIFANDDYFDGSLQTDSMEPINPQHVQRPRSEPGQSSAFVQRSSIYRSAPDESMYDGDENQADLHQALVEAGWVKSDTPDTMPPVQRTPADNAQSASGNTPESGNQADLHQALVEAGWITPDTPNPFSSSDTGNTYPVQRATDEDGSGVPQPGSVTADMLSILNLPDNTPVVGLNRLESNLQQDVSPAAASSPQIQRTPDPAPQIAPRVQRENIDTSSDSSETGVTDNSNSTMPNVEEVARKVYQQLRDRFRKEWERRNRF